MLCVPPGWRQGTSVPGGASPHRLAIPSEGRQVSGGTLLGFTLFSMGWLFFLAGAAVNFAAWRRARRAPAGTRYGGVALLPGLIGSVTAFFSVGTLLKAGWHVPWPWLWVLLPLFLDAGCVARLARTLLGLGSRPRGRA